MEAEQGALRKVACAADIMDPGSCMVRDYEVVEHVHRSRCFDVYRVRREGGPCVYAAKTISPHPEDRPAAWWSLLREGRLLCSLSHPRVVRGHELLVRWNPVLIMESLSGTSLEEHLGEDGPLPFDEAAHLALEVADALHYLHEHGLLHLDLSPDNVLCVEGHAKLIDLSIARKPGPGVCGRGKRAFMAPEQARGVNVTPATDVWGLGGLLFDCLTGHPPFEVRPGRRYEQLEHHAHPVHEYREVPEELDALIYRCLEPDPTERPSVDEAMEVLDRVLDRA